MTDPRVAPVDIAQVHRLEVLDHHGRVRAVVGELPSYDEDTEPIIGLSLLDPHGRRRAYLSLDEGGPSLAFDSGGTNVLQLGVTDAVGDAVKPGAYAFVADAAGDPKAYVHVYEDGQLDLNRGDD